MLIGAVKLKILEESYSHSVNSIINRLKIALKAETDASLCGLINISTPTLANWRKRNSLDHKLILSVCESNKIDLNWLFNGIEKIDLVTEVKTQYSKEIQALPLIPIDAIAGYANGNTDLTYLDSEKYVIPEFRNKADFLIRISGTSMSPKYFNGDIVACKKVPTETFLQWGKVYVMDTEQGAICKRVLASKKKHHIICRSENAELYPDFEMHWNKVRSLAIVIGTIRLE